MLTFWGGHIYRLQSSLFELRMCCFNVLLIDLLNLSKTNLSWPHQRLAHLLASVDKLLPCLRLSFSWWSSERGDTTHCTDKAKKLKHLETSLSRWFSLVIPISGWRILFYTSMNERHPPGTSRFLSSSERPSSRCQFTLWQPSSAWAAIKTPPVWSTKTNTAHSHSFPFFQKLPKSKSSMPKLHLPSIWLVLWKSDPKPCTTPSFWDGLPPWIPSAFLASKRFSANAVAMWKQRSRKCRPRKTQKFSCSANSCFCNVSYRSVFLVDSIYPKSLYSFWILHVFVASLDGTSKWQGRWCDTVTTKSAINC